MENRRKKTQEKVHKLDVTAVKKHKNDIVDVVYRAMRSTIHPSDKETTADVDKKKTQHLLQLILKKNSQPYFGVMNGKKVMLKSGVCVHLKDHDNKLDRQTTNVSCYVLFSNPIDRPRVFGVCLVSPVVILASTREQQGENVWTIVPCEAVYINYLAISRHMQRQGHGERLLIHRCNGHGPDETCQGRARMGTILEYFVDKSTEK